MQLKNRFRKANYIKAEIALKLIKIKKTRQWQMARMNIKWRFKMLIKKVRLNKSHSPFIQVEK